MTTRLPAWSTNLSVNVPKDARDLLGRLAQRTRAKSVGALIKHLVERGLEQTDKASAAEWREIKKRYYGAALVLLFVPLLFMGDRQELRRSKANHRVRTVAVKRQEEVPV